MSEAGVIAVAFEGRVGAFALSATFTVPASGVTVLFGPSGCGKTSVLRCIAGLQRVERGSCVVAGEVWQDAKTFRAPHRRPVGYVFQEARLFAHLTVRANLLFAARDADGVVGRSAVGFDEAVALLNLSALLDRSPYKLSGGERQRVAIGRALLSQPKLLLMDEPLSGLDQDSKDEIIVFLHHLQTRLGLPIVFVTHDRGEVERLARTVVLMESGRVVAAGSLTALQSDPTMPLASARDAAVSLDAVAESNTADGLACFSVSGGLFLVPAPALDLGSRHRLRIAAGDVSLTREATILSTIVNVLPARILDVVSTSEYEMTVVLGLGLDGDGARILSRVTRRSWTRLALAVGEPIFAQVKGVALATGPDAGPAAPPRSLIKSA